MIDSFSNGLLEYPQYTRPEIYDGKRVPDVLLSGHHANIKKYRHEESLKRTAMYRPDLLENLKLNKEDQKVVDSVLKNPKNNSCAKSIDMVILIGVYA
mgnify:CR=1 FL=1